MMANLREFLVEVDATGDIVGTKDAGEADVTTRTIHVLAKTAVDAEKRAKVLLGLGKR
jgi:hypothetical protein